MVRLHFERVFPGHQQPVLLLHGLLGRADNFRNVVSSPALKDKATIYLPDLRNHGQSPKRLPMHLSDLSNDIQQFIVEQQLRNLTVVAHSLSGRAMVEFTKNKVNQGLIDKLVIIDVHPHSYTGNKAARDNVQLLKRMSGMALGHTVQESKELIRKAFLAQKDRIVAFSNLSKQNTWRFDPELVCWFESSLSFEVRERLPWSKPVYVVYGEQSEYVEGDRLEQQYSSIYGNFRGTRKVQAGHWMHWEKPNETAETLACLIFD